MKVYKYICITCFTGLCALISACALSKHMEPKQRVFEFPVNTQIPKEASLFFDKGEGAIVFQTSNVNIKKIGNYQATIVYKKKEFPIEIHMKDTEKPEVKLIKNRLVVALHMKVDEVQELMRKNMMITDNYDTVFEELSLLSSMPTTEKEMVFSIQIKDASGNESNAVEMVVQFTKSGKMKEKLGKEKTSVSTTAKPQVLKPVHTPSSAKPESPNSLPPSKPQHPPKPDTLPMLTVENFPIHAVGNSGRVFTTYDQAYEWANVQATTLGSPWFEYQMDISNPYIPGYANTGSDDAPYTVSFWNYNGFG